MLGGLKSASMRGNADENYNGIVFDDEMGKEHLAIHSERHLSFTSEFDKLFHSGRHKVEQVSHMSLFTVGHLPGVGGGSGGGPGGPDPYDAYPPPQAIGMWGLNGQVIYGENLQVAVGLNHQVALGSNLQVCINPGGLAAGAPPGDTMDIQHPGSPGLTAALGSGLGGNMQLTVGTSASFIYGRSFNITLGPKAFNVDPGGYAHPDSTVIIKQISFVYLLWLLTYALFKDNDTDTNCNRSGITLDCQLVIQLFLKRLMDAEIKWYQGNTDADKKIDDELFKLKVPTAGPPPPADFHEEFGGLTETLAWIQAVVAAMVLPVAMEVRTAAREKKSSS
jgi:hypothetical protein